MNDKVKLVLDGIVEQFKTGNIPEAITLSMFPVPDLPSSNWSLLNRTAMFVSGTMDARGYKQWRSVNRYDTKGSKAIYILVPIFRNTDNGGDDGVVLTGFTAKPVYRSEDTDGEPLEYEDIELPELPLISRAEEWGLSVRAVPGNYRYLGSYSQTKKEIVLASPDESVLFHELAHHADSLINGKLTKGQDPLQEITAELAAASLCHLVGKQSNTLGNSYQYIERYADKLNMSAHGATLKVLSNTEKILRLILLAEDETVVA